MFTHRWITQSGIAYRNLTLLIARLLIRLAILIAFQDLQTQDESMVSLHQRSNYSLSTLAVWWLFFVYSFQLYWLLWVRYPSALYQYFKYQVLYPAAHLTSFCLRSLASWSITRIGERVFLSVWNTFRFPIFTLQRYYFICFFFK